MMCWRNTALTLRLIRELSKYDESLPVGGFCYKQTIGGSTAVCCCDVIVHFEENSVPQCVSLEFMIPELGPASERE